MLIYTTRFCVSAVSNISYYKYLSDCRSRGHKFDPGRSHTFVVTDYEMIDAAFSSLPLIPEGLLSVTSESMCRKYWLTALVKLVKERVWLGELDHPVMTIALDLDIKYQTKQAKETKILLSM